MYENGYKDSGNEEPAFFYYNFWEIKIGDEYESEESTHTYIDHMFIEPYQNQENSAYIFGSMRSSDVYSPGSSFHVWRL